MNKNVSEKTLYFKAFFGIIALMAVLLAIPSGAAHAEYQLAGTGIQAGQVGRYIDYYNHGTQTYGNGTTIGNGNGQYNNGQYGNGSYNGGSSTGNISPDTQIVISTEPATDIKTTSALIQGAAHVGGGTATVWFEWGTRVDRLDHTTRSVLIDQMSTGDSEVLTNLAPGTKYYFRIVAHNAGGTCYGIVRSFTTKGGTTVTSTSTTHVVATASAATTHNDGAVKGSLSAAAANANSSSILPTSVTGWIVVIVLVFLIAVVVRAIQRESEERKKREEEAKKLKAA